MPTHIHVNIGIAELQLEVLRLELTDRIWGYGSTQLEIISVNYQELFLRVRSIS